MEGKKPFYLTVDCEGKPHGTGRPAWVAEINKLVAGLDPSCTDIRKQAYGDICIFKDRLNEHFEYSRDPSEHHMRALMGKAVTRRRTDLIALIKSGGEHPTNVNEEVWKRLENLATSEQREKKSEQGRYANACRRTEARTSALGEDGTRQCLRKQLGRSLDPDEVADEMQRHKGFGKSKSRSSGAYLKRGLEHVDNVYKKDAIKFLSPSSGVERLHSDEEEGRNEEFEGNFCNQVSNL